jgi:hypothetical protein
MEPAKGIRWALVGLAGLVAVGCGNVAAVEPTAELPAVAFVVTETVVVVAYDCYAAEVDNHVAVLEHDGSYDGLWNVWNAHGCDYAPDGAAVIEAIERFNDGRE